MASSPKGKANAVGAIAPLSTLAASLLLNFIANLLTSGAEAP